ncbi:MAG TPA: class I SAM-dependent methyltransferase [Xanthobacteraceae bacterium]|nr:class I SAM-dependent methyltransferase [Xanthobacteraceae bacterium]
MTSSQRGLLTLADFVYQHVAWAYDLHQFAREVRRYRRIRPRMFRGLSGRILDAGVGTGRNFPFYPPGSSVVGIDLSAPMLARAQRRRASAAAAVELRQMDVTRMDFPDRSFDAAVAALLFSTLPYELHVPATRELRRVVKPGGVIRCLEYDRPSGRGRRTCRVFELPEGRGWQAVGSL